MLTTEHQQNVVIARVTEKRVDASKAPAFTSEMSTIIEGGANRIVLDLSAVDFIDSSGLGAVVSCLKRLGPTGSLAIAGAHDAVRRLFTLTRMDKVFRLHDNVEAAVADLNGMREFR